MNTRTVNQALAELGAHKGNDLGYTFLAESGASDLFRGYAEIAASTARLALGLQRLGLSPGDRVALAVPDQKDFVSLFLAAMHAALIPVPLPLPTGIKNLQSFTRSASHIFQSSGASVVIAGESIEEAVNAAVDPGVDLRVLGVAEVEAGERELQLPDFAPARPAFLQFTSGSTALPKGVAVGHDNLIANATAIMRDGLGVRPGDRACTWLPLFHDMGLIGFTVAPIIGAIDSVLMPPQRFLKRPIEWLRMMSAYQGTISFAPSFAYALCCNRIRPQDLDSDLDLTRWRVAGCGAERVDWSVLEGFAERFAPAGFRGEALMPCYGLAEATLAVSFAERAPRTNTETLDLEHLATTGACRAPQDAASPTTSVANCGRPFPGHHLAILDGDGHELAERRLGQIAIEGPSVTRGYWNNIEAGAPQVRRGPLLTGDIGYLSDGDLYVYGRSKETIIVAGRNYDPSEIEAVVSSHPAVRAGNVAAFGVNDPRAATEKIVVCAEAARPQQDPGLLSRELIRRVGEATGLHVTDLLLVERDRIPKTSSGKIQRKLTQRLYEQGMMTPIVATAPLVRESETGLGAKVG